jgi:hypothetical protein
LHPKRQCLIEVNFGRCGGRLALDWVNLRKFSSNFLDNWSVGNSLIVKDWLVLTVDGGGAVISSEMLMYDRGEFGWCGGGLELDWMYLGEFSSNFHKN